MLFHVLSLFNFLITRLGYSFILGHRKINYLIPLKSATREVQLKRRATCFFTFSHYFFSIYYGCTLLHLAHLGIN